MPGWLDLPEVLSEDRYQEVLEDLLAALEAHLNAPLARSMRILGETFTEWRAQGVYVYDPQGQAYFDGAGAGGVFGLGHCHPRVVEAVRRQLERGGLSCRVGLVPGLAELARRLSSLTQGRLPYCFVGSSGSEAVEAALKMARLTTGRPGLVGTVLGYHGMTIASLSVSGIPYWREGFPPLLEACKLVPYGDLAAMERAIDATTAAVILEPVQWASGCTVAPPGYLAGLRRLCDERGALLIVDEIQTGLGRTGKLLALDHWGVTPDILCLGKVLSGGVVPVSAAVYGPRVQQALLARPMFNNSTYGGNPLACAAAVATLEVLEAEGLVERARVLGQALEAGLARLIAAFPDILVEQRGLGLMRCLFTRDPRYGAMLAILLTSQHRVLLPCMIHAPYVIRFSPPFITSDAQLEQMLGAVEGALGRVREMGTAGIDRYFQEVNQKVSAPR